MPGKKLPKSIRAPQLYEKLKKHGFSKESAARLSNWMRKRGYKVGRKRK